jgi:methyl-accepting chemotaxis protein
VQQDIEGYHCLRDDRVLPLSRDQDLEGAMAAARDAATFAGTATEAFSAMNEIELAAAEVRAEQSAAKYEDARTLSAPLLLAGLALSIGFAVVVARMITRPLGRVNEVLAKVAGGDLTARADIDTRDDVGQMARWLDVATGNMRRPRRRTR